MQEGNLHKWFKGSKSKDGKSGWVNVVTGGTCASDEPGEGTPKCVSSSKRASMTKAERKSAARRKKAADPGQQSKTGAAKPTYVSTDPKKKMKEESVAEDYKKLPKGKMGMKAGKKFISAVKDTVKGESEPEGTIPQQIGQQKAAKKTRQADKIHNVAGKHNETLSRAKSMKNKLVGMTKKEEYEIEEEDKKGKSSGKKDACYHKVKASASVWPSAYASGRLVQCRKKGAKNYGNSTKKEEFENLPELSQMQINAMRNAGIEVDVLNEKCWVGYTQKGMKKKGGKMVPNCVPKNEETQSEKDRILERLTLGEGIERIPSESGKVYLVSFLWRGKYMMMKLFFPELKQPNKRQVQAAMDKVYPGSKVMRFDASMLDNKDTYIRVPDMSEETEVTEAVKGQDTEMRKAASAERKSGEKRLAPSKGKGYADQQKQSINYMDKKTKNNKIIVGMTHEESVPNLGPDTTGYQDAIDEDIEEAAAWTKKSGKNQSGGLNEKGRKSYERENPGSDLKAPSKKKGNKRRASFCARMKGMKKKLTSAKTANDPDSRINKSLRAWNC